MWNRFTWWNVSGKGNLSFDEEWDDEEMLKNFYESLILPASKSGILNKWFTCASQIKNKPHLFIGKLIKRFLHDENGLITAPSIGCWKPPIGSGNILECIASHLPCDINVFLFQDKF